MSIIKLASELGGTSTLVMGKHAEGKTTAVVKDIIDRGLNPLWISFSNIEPLHDEVEVDWSVAQPASWEEFMKELFSSIVTGELDISHYDTVVLDGLNIAATLMLGSKATITQADYRNLGLTMQGVVAKLRSLFKNTYVVIDTVDSAEGEEKRSINRDLYNQLVSLFGRKWYAYAAPTKTGITYHIQKNPTLAVRFKPERK
jgi:hypothetical protein